jgi:hypothetical protein
MLVDLVTDCDVHGRLVCKPGEITDNLERGRVLTGIVDVRG